MQTKKRGNKATDQPQASDPTARNFQRPNDETDENTSRLGDAKIDDEEVEEEVEEDIDPVLDEADLEELDLDDEEADNIEWDPEDEEKKKKK